MLKYDIAKNEVLSIKNPKFIISIMSMLSNVTNHSKSTEELDYKSP